MEDPTAIETSQTNSTGRATQVPPSQAPSKKRKLSDGDIRSSFHFKIRSLVRELRSVVIEVIQAPDLRNCKAARELKSKMKIMIDLQRQMTGQTDPPQKVASKVPHFSGKNVIAKQSMQGHNDGKVSGLPHSKHSSEIPVEKEPALSFYKQEKLDDYQSRGSYVVGGSAVGWNFITYRGSRAVYYGVTKESYRETQKKSQTVDHPVNKPPTAT